ncbi:hypothetical protein KIL84_011204 [Mauremys mutica]|uniref:Uncharacterized protein n=1 Tax=Mauremys mutica TaxID=74926 RepID=A0A9D3XCL3_9SAUR|nr:hypothetical protein KIL84_011204 [Mauremys mutica]
MLRGAFVLWNLRFFNVERSLARRLQQDTHYPFQVQQPNGEEQPRHQAQQAGPWGVQGTWSHITQSSWRCLRRPQEDVSDAASLGCSVVKRGPETTFCTPEPALEPTNVLHTRSRTYKCSTCPTPESTSLLPSLLQNPLQN